MESYCQKRGSAPRLISAHLEIDRKKTERTGGTMRNDGFQNHYKNDRTEHRLHKVTTTIFKTINNKDSVGIK